MMVDLRELIERTVAAQDAAEAARAEVSRIVRELVRVARQRRDLLNDLNLLVQDADDGELMVPDPLVGENVAGGRRVAVSDPERRALVDELRAALARDIDSGQLDKYLASLIAEG